MNKLFRDPAVQLKFDIFQVRFWLVNMLVIGIIYYGLPAYYERHERFFVFYLIEISLYALVLTALGGISGSEAAINTGVTIEKADTVTINE